MISFNPIHLAYAVMILAMAFCFLLGRKNRRDIRNAVDDFALPFVRLSNHISPALPPKGILVTVSGNDRIQALPPERQSGSIRAIMRRANEETAVRLYGQLLEAADRLTSLGRGSKTWYVQFVEPVNEILEMTHVFLTGCENPDTIDTIKKQQQFDSFLMDQAKYRMILLKRISGTTADEYRKLNENYIKEMERLEQMDLEKKRKN